MPELPEVESVRQSLLPELCGRIITKIDILTSSVWQNDGLPAEGWRIDDIGRRGKYLIFELSRPGGDKSPIGKAAESKAKLTALLIVHLRMTGQLLLKTEDPPLEKHAHVRMRLDRPANDGQKDPRPLWLVYHDTRRFGRLWLLPANSRELLPKGLAALGPEPLDPGFDALQLARQLSKRQKSKLKAVLLDQSVIAGLGNIYADEVLFQSGLHPERTVASLDESELEKLAAAVVSVLRHAISCQGTTLRDYVNGWNQKGTFQNCLMVYKRAGLPCRICGQLIESRRIAGRTTCWCPNCQLSENAQNKPLGLLAAKEAKS